MLAISAVFVILHAVFLGTYCTYSTVSDKRVSFASDQSLWQTMRKAPLQLLMNNTYRTVKTGSVDSTTTLFPGCVQKKVQAAENHADNRRYVDLKGQILRVGVIPWPGTLLYNATTSTYSGYNFDLLVEISQLLNFSLSLVEPNDRQWGNLKNNTWNGLVEMLLKQETDMALGLAFTPERAQYIDFACHMYESKIKVWMLDPRLRQEDFFNIFDLMNPSVSWCLLTAFLFVVMVYTVSSALLSHDSVTGVHFLWRFYDNCFLFARPLLRQGELNRPISTTGRTLLSFWWWFSIILSVTYSGTLISSLADTRTLYPFTTVTEILGQDVFKWGYVGNSSIQSFIEGSKERHIQEIGIAVKTFAKSDPSVVSADPLLHQHKMTTEKYLFIGDFENPAATNFVSLRDIIDVQQMCIGFHPNSKLTTAFQTVLSDLNTFGILYKLSKENAMLANKSKTPKSMKHPKVTLHLVKSVFNLAAVGTVLSACVLVLEFVHRKVHFALEKRTQRTCNK